MCQGVLCGVSSVYFCFEAGVQIDGLEPISDFGLCIGELLFRNASWKCLSGDGSCAAFVLLLSDDFRNLEHIWVVHPACLAPLLTW